jgi:hypothetical protein
MDNHDSRAGQALQSQGLQGLQQQRIAGAGGADERRKNGLSWESAVGAVKPTIVPAKIGRAT